jgi:hypothetical protein
MVQSDPSKQKANREKEGQQAKAAAMHARAAVMRALNERHERVFK